MKSNENILKYKQEGKVKEGNLEPLRREQSLEELKENLLICALNEMIDNGLQGVD